MLSYHLKLWTCIDALAVYCKRQIADYSGENKNRSLSYSHHCLWLLTICQSQTQIIPVCHWNICYFNSLWDGTWFILSIVSIVNHERGHLIFFFLWEWRRGLFQELLFAVLTNAHCWQRCHKHSTFRKSIVLSSSSPSVLFLTDLHFTQSNNTQCPVEKIE